MISNPESIIQDIITSLIVCKITLVEKSISLIEYYKKFPEKSNSENLKRIFMSINDIDNNIIRIKNESMLVSDL